MDWTDIYSSRQNRTILSATVTGVEEVALGSDKIPCLVLKGPKGLIPLPESGIEPGPNKMATLNRLMNFLNQEVSFIVIGIDRENDLYIASRKQALERLAAVTWQSLEVGQVRPAVVRRHLKAFSPKGKERLIGLIVEIRGVEGFLPAEEISHGFAVEDIPQPGEEIRVKVIKLDPENKKLVVSRKATIPDPWPDCVNRYKKGGTYSGKVTGVVEYGVFVELEPGVSCLCRHLKVGKAYPGDTVAVTVRDIDAEKRRISGIVSRVLMRAV